jgi:membrane protein
MQKTAIKNIIDNFSEKRLSTVAGAWVFYFLTSVIPLAFLVLTVFGVFGVELTEDVVSRLPIEFRAAGDAIVSTARRASKGATLLFVITAVLSCVRLLNQMSKDGDFLYGKKATVKRGVLRRVWAIFALGALFAVFLIAAVLIAIGGNFLGFSYALGGLKKLLSVIIIFTLVIFFSFLIIIMLNKFICPHKLKFKEMAIGAMVSLGAIVLGTIGFALYLRFFNSYNAFYGSLAGIIVFLLWAYILMVGLVAGVIVNVMLKQKNQHKKILKNNKNT